MGSSSLFDLANVLIEFGQEDPVGYMFAMLRLAVVAGGCFSFAVLLLMTLVQLATMIGERRAAIGQSMITRTSLPSLLGPSSRSHRSRNR